MDQGHAPGPVLEILTECPAPFGVLIGTIKAQERDERGQVVLDPVMDLGEKDLLFRKRLL